MTGVQRFACVVSSPMYRVNIVPAISTGPVSLDELWRRARGRPGGQPYGAYECASGATYVLSRDSLAGCASTRWCDVPFGRLERCLRESFLDGPERICRDGPTAACEGLLACLPGVVWEPSKRR